MTNLETLKKVVSLFDTISEPDESVSSSFRLSFMMVKASLHGLMAQCRLYELAESFSQDSSQGG